MIIDGKDTGEKTFIIAEIGVNHEGDFRMAERLILDAARTAVDAVKFQTFKADEYISRQEDRERYARAKRFQLSYAQFGRLAKLAHRQGLIFISTPLDFESVDAMEEMVSAFKVASCDFTNIPLIKHIISKGKPVILSTGLSDADEISRVLKSIGSFSPSGFINTKLALLHCVCSYPVVIDEANLNAIPYMKERFGVTVGYSDHTIGTLAAKIAVGLGARIIEKHFTCRKERQEFRDHILSADIKDMSNLVKDIRQIERLLGEKTKEITKSEQEMKVSMRRSLGARKNIAQGESVARNAVTFLRPAIGIPAEELEKAINKKALRNIRKGEIITYADIE